MPKSEQSGQTKGSGLPRVVLVGFNKCATRSLASLFARAGHRVVHHKLRFPFRRSRVAARIMRENLQAGRKVFAGMEDFTFYCDLIDVTPSVYYEGNAAFREILRDYPDTILLLNLRDREAWINSRMKHGRGEFVARSLKVLGLADRASLAEHWRRIWDAHLDDVRSFMKDRPAQLVEFDIDHDDVSALCDRLSRYGLNPADWGDIGRSRGRKPWPVAAWIKATWSHRRPRA